MNFRKAFASLTLVLALFCAPLSAAAGIDLSEKDQAALTQAEKYFGRLTRLQARFIQVAPSGEYSEGAVFIHRPGRMRLEYDPPVPIVLIADGTFFIYYDRELEQATHLFLNDTPAGVMLREKLSFADKDITVAEVKFLPGLIEITVFRTDDPEAGRLTLVFTEAPYELKQWRVVDGQGEETTVSLFDVAVDVDLPDALFKFKRPKLTNN